MWAELSETSRLVGRPLKPWVHQRARRADGDSVARFGPPVLKCKSGDSGRPMPSHKFKIGDLVRMKPSISRNVPGGTYQVTKRLPENDGEFEYQIKNVEEPYVRVAREGELTKA
jgi:hypothetical protein